MKHRFSVVLDSAFRERTVYPLSTRFIVPVNDSVTTPYINSPLTIFSWADPIRFRVGNVGGGSQSIITLSEDLQSDAPNYFVGCQLQLLDGTSVLESSTIIAYDNVQNTVKVAVPFTNNIQINDNIRIAYPDSLANPYILQITGYNSDTLFEYGSLYLYNYSRKWIRRILSISSTGLANLKEPIPLGDYSYSDIFEIRTSPQIIQYPLTTVMNGVTNYQLQRGLYDYQVGTIVYIEPDDPVTGIRQTFRIMSKDPNDGSLTLEIVAYGGPFVQSRSYPLIPLEDPLVDVDTLTYLFALQTRTIIDAQTEFIPSPEQNVLYLGQTIVSEFFYFNYEIQGTYILLIDDVYPYELAIDLDRFDDPSLQFYGFLRKTVVQCALNVANFSIPDNQVCMAVTLDCLILPNRVVKNYNKLLSFFPYVIVRLYNIEAPQYSKYGNITTNNPYSTNAQFICPIGNLLNPTLIKFVEVRSDMEQTLKLSPYQDLFFEVLLPDGTLLEFEEELSSIASIISSYTFTIRDTVACLLSFRTV